MFRFAYPEFLYLLLIIPLMVGYHIYTSIYKRKQLRKLGDKELIEQLMPMYSHRRAQIKYYMIILALIFMIILIARPQFGSKMEIMKRNGVEVMVALDISNSMLAQDLSPNRLENSKLLLTKMIDEMKNDKVGLVVFAGDAFTQIPITADFISAKMFMPSVSPSLISTQGTAIGTAIDLSIKSFGKKGKAGRTIIVITDGENHEDDAVSAAKLAADNGIAVHVIGVGKPEGSPIPIDNRDNFKRDKNGNIVISRLNEQMCQEIAQAGNGIYVRADNSNRALKNIQKEIDKMSKADIETKIFSEYSEQFAFFAFIVLFLLIIELFILERKSKWHNKIKLF